MEYLDFELKIDVLTDPFGLFDIDEDGGIYLINYLDYENIKQHKISIEIRNNNPLNECK